MISPILKKNVFLELWKNRRKISYFFFDSQRNDLRTTANENELMSIY